ncbi:hypothetical protein CSOJ01_14316 [Colletotrichum sojae]|uniref:Uncharacterized protein n=1 Tax=Colletotrichum sojae TaxID=2175907 RepID=A0A8H6MK98_9PEZI|nr:hypothetical protein CSOJ01_14316 [Colletotrichum sojae]
MDAAVVGEAAPLIDPSPNALLVFGRLTFEKSFEAAAATVTATAGASHSTTITDISNESRTTSSTNPRTAAQPESKTPRKADDADDHGRERSVKKPETWDPSVTPSRFKWDRYPIR